MVASGIVRSGEDRVQVLVFVNRPTTRADRPSTELYRDQVVMTMERSGDDWLVDDMDTNQLAELTGTPPAPRRPGHASPQVSGGTPLAQHPQFRAEVLDLSPGDAPHSVDAMRISRGAALKAAR